MDITTFYKASEIHNRIKNELTDFIKKGTKLIDICYFIENRIKLYSSNTEKNNGIAFPVGLSLNNIAAHWTPQKNDNTVLNKNDVLKIDYGVHNNGCIIDSAFTWCDDCYYNPLIKASEDAVKNIIKNIGVDTSISEIGDLSQEIVSSYELEKNGVFKPIKIIDNICGHSILPWKVHGTKLIQNIPNNDKTKIEENDILAIEVYTSDGLGTTIMGRDNSHFMINKKSKQLPLTQRSEEILDIIDSSFGSLAFTQRYLEDRSPIKYFDVCLDELYRKGILKKYPPLIDPDKKCKTAQYEHTIYVSENRIIDFNEI